ncbi:MAG: hypothetical protein O2780_18385 [Proteobacteria bacterium]|nr:hypothetical protein [Pseudomonadota bacterium]
MSGPLGYALALLLTACGGGGSDGGGRTNMADTPPVRVASIEFLDQMPGDGAAAVPGFRRGVAASQVAPGGTTFTYATSCSDQHVLVTVRDIEDVSGESDNVLVTHDFSCASGFGPDESVTITVSGEHSSGPTEGSFSFTTGNELPVLTVDAELRQSELDVASGFAQYISGALIDELDLPALSGFLIRGLILDLAASEWRALADPDVDYPVVFQRLHFSSSAPNGDLTTASGLLAFPDRSDLAEFQPRDRVILLHHATGSTPSAMDPTDAWYILAGLFAARGYLVFAPDNHGRGVTAELPETYLMAQQTATVAVDFMMAVLDSGHYVAIFDDESPVPLSIVGYSQGGHSAIASWLEIAARHSDSLTVLSVHSGGGPHQIYRTFRGVLEQIDGRCGEEDDYCRLVDPATMIPFATGHILPGLLDYGPTSLEVTDVIEGDTLRTDFITDFLGQAERLDDLRLWLQLNSFGNILNGDSRFGAMPTTIHLYHSPYDRLVPAINTTELAAALGTVVSVEHHSNECSSDGFELIFQTTDRVGVLHTLCGLNVMDQILRRL